MVIKEFKAQAALKVNLVHKAHMDQEAIEAIKAQSVFKAKPVLKANKG